MNDEIYQTYCYAFANARRGTPADFMMRTEHAHALALGVADGAERGSSLRTKAEGDEECARLLGTKSKPCSCDGVRSVCSQCGPSKSTERMPSCEVIPDGSGRPFVFGERVVERGVPFGMMRYGCFIGARIERGRTPLLMVLFEGEDGVALMPMEDVRRLGANDLARED